MITEPGMFDGATPSFGPILVVEPRKFNINGVEWRWPHLVLFDVQLEKDHITLFVETRERETGVLQSLCFRTDFDEQYAAGVPEPARTKNLIRDAYLKLVCHELDELLRIPGEWKDPHDENDAHAVHQNVQDQRTDEARSV